MSNPDCTCKCSPEEHGPHGCKTWFGDKNTGFRCNCDWRSAPDKPLRSTHKDRLALDCGRQIIEALKERGVWPDPAEAWMFEELRQEIAQIILKSGFEKL